MSTTPPSTLPELPGGLFNAPPDSVLVEDADEEVSEGESELVPRNVPQLSDMTFPL